MSYNPGPEGARWNVPDWDPNEGSTQTTYLDRINSLEVELENAHKEIANLKVELASTHDRKAGLADSSISSTPSPKHKVMVRENADTFRLNWSELHRFARIEKLDIEKIIQDNPLPVLIKAAFVFLNQHQIDEISEREYTFLSLDQVDEWYKSGGTLQIELDEWLRFESAGFVSVYRLSIKTLYLLSHIPKFKEEASRRDVEKKIHSENVYRVLQRDENLSALKKIFLLLAKILGVTAAVLFVWFGAQYIYKYVSFSKIWSWLFI